MVESKAGSVYKLRETIVGMNDELVRILNNLDRSGSELFDAVEQVKMEKCEGTDTEETVSESQTMEPAIAALPVEESTNEEPASLESFDEEFRKASDVDHSNEGTFESGPEQEEILIEGSRFRFRMVL